MLDERERINWEKRPCVSIRFICGADMYMAVGFSINLLILIVVVEIRSLLRVVIILWTIYIDDE